MSNIHQFDLIWKDTYPGVWTALVELYGCSFIAYAIEVEANEDGEQIAVTQGGRDRLHELRDATQNYAFPFKTVTLGEHTVVILLLPDADPGAPGADR